MVACLEWSVFVSTHQLGSRWKEKFTVAPLWVKKVMENGEIVLERWWDECEERWLTDVK